MQAPMILVVEDEVLICMMIEDILVAGGFETMSASTLDEASGLIARERFAAVILDIGVGGEAMFPFARSLSARGVPYIFTSGYERDKLPADLSHAGYLQKPFLATAMLTTVCGCVSAAVR
jgi:DNA-binding response OmpR family regulator